VAQVLAKKAILIRAQRTMRSGAARFRSDGRRPPRSASTLAGPSRHVRVFGGRRARVSNSVLFDREEAAEW